MTQQIASAVRSLGNEPLSRGEAAHVLDVCLATAANEIRRRLAYAIDVVRAPLYPALTFLTWLLAYRVSGRATVDGFDTAGYLLVGTVGMILWSSCLWAGGYAIEYERRAGTLSALILSPASRAAIVLGYALGGLVVGIVPNVLVVGAIAAAFGVRIDVADPAALALATLGLIGATVASSFSLAGLFVLSRRANLLANFLQSPIYLLTGMVVPIASLPGPLHLIAWGFPISAGMNATRATLLSGAALGDVAGSLVRLVLLSAFLIVVGIFLLGKVEHVARRSADIDLD